MRALLLALAVAVAVSGFAIGPTPAAAQSTPTPSPAPCTVPYIFVPLTVAQAPQVNANFAALEGCINSFVPLPSPTASSTGCGVLSWGPNFALNGDFTACGGGGGSFVCNAVNSCVTFQTTASPSPESTGGGTVGSAAVIGILQGGQIYSTSGDFEVAGGGSFLHLCPNEQCSFWTVHYDGTGVNQVTNGSIEQYTGGAEFGSTPVTPVQGHFDVTESNGPGGDTEYTLQTGSGTDSYSLLTSSSVNPAGTTEVQLYSHDAASGHVSLTVQPPDLGGVEIFGQTNISGSGGLWTDPSWSGLCTMSSTTTCTKTVTGNYSTPACLATAQGSTAMAAACSISGTTLTITAASSNSLTWAFLVFGATP